MHLLRLGNLRERFRKERLPNFLVLGTQKGGTTSLQKLLDHHPGVFLPPCKEVHYFSLHADRPKSWYASHYKDARWHQKRGDITPYYLFHPLAPKRIKATVPKARLIVLLRDPVERTLSQYFHARRHGFEQLGVSEALTAERERLSSGDPYSHQKHSYQARSRYLEQLDRYESLFPKSRILVIKSEDLFNDSEGAWGQIQRFLRIKPITLPIRLPRENAGHGEASHIDPEIRHMLKREFSATAKGIKERYGIDWGWQDDETQTAQEVQNLGE